MKTAALVSIGFVLLLPSYGSETEKARGTVPAAERAGAGIDSEQPVEISVPPGSLTQTLNDQFRQARELSLTGQWPEAAEKLLACYDRAVGDSHGRRVRGTTILELSRVLDAYPEVRPALVERRDATKAAMQESTTVDASRSSSSSKKPEKPTSWRNSTKCWQR